MRSRTAQWFECKIKYEKTTDDGVQKKVTELYVVNALSFTEAESSIIEEQESFVSGEFEVTDIKKAKYSEIFFSDKESDDKFYKVRIQFITLDEKTGKEKITSNLYVVQSSSLENAVKYIGDIMGGSMIDYKSAKVEETSIMDIYEHSTSSTQTTEHGED